MGFLLKSLATILFRGIQHLFHIHTYNLLNSVQYKTQNKCENNRSSTTFSNVLCACMQEYTWGHQCPKLHTVLHCINRHCTREGYSVSTRKCQESNPHIRTAPSVLKEAGETYRDPSVHYKEKVCSSTVPATHEAILKPRNSRQVKMHRCRLEREEGTHRMTCSTWWSWRMTSKTTPTGWKWQWQTDSDWRRSTSYSACRKPYTKSNG